MDDQMQLLGIAELKPGACKWEWRPRDFYDRQDLTIELSRPLDVRDGKRNVVDGVDFHAAMANLPLPDGKSRQPPASTPTAA
jgi:hypothetical protein